MIFFKNQEVRNRKIIQGKGGGGVCLDYPYWTDNHHCDPINSKEL